MNMTSFASHIENKTILMHDTRRINTQSFLGISRGDVFLFCPRKRYSARASEIDAKLHLATSRTRWKSCYPFYALFLRLWLYFSHDSIPITSTKSEIIPLAASRNRIHIPRDFRDCWKLQLLQRASLLPFALFCTNQNQYLILNIKKQSRSPPVTRFHRVISP